MKCVFRVIVNKYGNVHTFDNIGNFFGRKTPWHIKLCRKNLTFADTALPTENGFIYKSKEYPLSLKGTYQPQNAAVVLEITSALNKQGFNISFMKNFFAIMPPAFMLNWKNENKWHISYRLNCNSVCSAFRDFPS